MSDPPSGAAAIERPDPDVRAAPAMTWRHGLVAVVATVVLLTAGARAPPASDPAAGGPDGTVPASASAPAPSVPGAPSPPSVPAPTSTPTTATPGSTAYAVATTTRTFDDPERGRSLPTTIYYPAAAPAPGPRTVGDAVVDATASAGPAPATFPLVLMVHGYLLPGDGYERIMRVVAAHGYVVAAPEHPHTTGHGGDGLRADLTNQPGDLSVVADQVVALGASGTAIPAIADPERIAVVGHSDGGLTATAFGYGHQFRDRRVASVVSLTGGVGLFPGAFYAPDSPPVLAVHARDDGTNPYSASVNLFNGVPPDRPRFLLTIESGGHIDPYMFATGRLDLGDAIAAFLDLTVGNDPEAIARLHDAATRPGFTLEEG